MTEDREEKEPETPTMTPATTQARKTKTETEGDAMKTEEEESKDDGTEEADPAPTAEIDSKKIDPQSMMQKTRAFISLAPTPASNQRS